MRFSLLLVGLFITYCNGASRLAGGELTTIAHYPFAVALLTNSGAGSFAFSCGGTLVRANLVLTAAACVHNGESAHEAAWWRVRVGSSYSDRGGLIHLVRAITVHPEFVMTPRAHDLAVLRPTIPVTLQPGLVEVARFAGAAYTFVETVPVTAIGWGEGASSNQLQHVEIYPVNQALCNIRYNQLGVTISNDVVCAGLIDVGVRGQCEGDTGSPLVDSNGIVVGVFSWAEGCAHILYPGINTRVSNYISWIESVLE